MAFVKVTKNQMIALRLMRIQGATLKSHVDKNDARLLFCVVIPLGRFKGANLRFPYLNMKLRFMPKSIAVIRSHMLDHCTDELEDGERYSLVLYADHNLFNEKSI